MTKMTAPSSAAVTVMDQLRDARQELGTLVDDYERMRHRKRDFQALLRNSINHLGEVFEKTVKKEGCLPMAASLDRIVPKKSGRGRVPVGRDAGLSEDLRGAGGGVGDEDQSAAQESPGGRSPSCSLHGIVSRSTSSHAADTPTTGQTQNTFVVDDRVSDRRRGSPAGPEEVEKAPRVRFRATAQVLETREAALSQELDRLERLAAQWQRPGAWETADAGRISRLAAKVQQVRRVQGIGAGRPVGITTTP